MNIDHLQTLYTEAVKIANKERSARQYVFRDNPPKLAAKLAEIDRLKSILAELKDALKPHCEPAIPAQPTLLDVPPKTRYP